MLNSQQSDPTKSDSDKSCMQASLRVRKFIIMKYIYPILYLHHPGIIIIKSNCSCDFVSCTYTMRWLLRGNTGRSAECGWITAWISTTIYFHKNNLGDWTFRPQRAGLRSEKDGSLLYWHIYVWNVKPKIDISLAFYFLCCTYYAIFDYSFSSQFFSTSHFICLRYSILQV